MVITSRREYGLGMNKTSFLLGGSALVLVLAGCVTAGSPPRAHQPSRSDVRTVIMFEDDYEYYPRYEIYYSRRRNEYVYRDRNAWVRRSELPGISLSLLTAGPMVRMDFHDSPEFHHGNVVQRFPRNWEQSGPDQRGPRDRRADRKSDEQKKKNETRDDRKDDREDDRSDHDVKSDRHRN